MLPGVLSALKKQREHCVSQFRMWWFADANPRMKSDVPFTSEAAKLGRVKLLFDGATLCPAANRATAVRFSAFADGLNGRGSDLRTARFP